MSATPSHVEADLSNVQAPSFDGIRKVALIAGIGAGVGALALGMLQEGGTRHLQFAWLFACMYFLTLGLGALFFVLLQHVTRAGWSVVVRRIAEHVMASLPWIALLLTPLVVLALTGNNDLFKWANLEKVGADPKTAGALALYEHKAPYLNSTFFLIRFLVYVVVWVLLVRYFRGRSLAQDQDGNPMHTVIMQRRSAPAVILFALTLTFAAIDFMMTLDAPWFSTIWGVYIFAGAFVSFMSLLGLLTQRSENQGQLKGLVTPEHYHDIGKLMFAFVFFWSYIGFSQFVLIWYADIPEETLWFKHRMEGPFATVSVILLFGHCFIPFLGLLSRHVKRHRFGLKFWAIWLLVMHAVDLYWVIMPNFDDHHIHVPFLEVLCWISVAGIFTFAALGSASNKPLTPVKDPRLAESLAFQNV